tara:strand:+ start:12039 stop:12458 length:420 start_codon:yes stop_codon:yes gene_type:complete
MILYHITPFRKVKNILRRGLTPPVYLSNKRDLNQWLKSAVIHFYNSGRGGSLSVLEANVPNNWFYDGSQIYKGNADIAPEYIVGELIHRDRIKLLETVRVKQTVERGIREGWLVQVMPSGKEVKPKWKSRKRKQFARVS